MSHANTDTTTAAAAAAATPLGTGATPLGAGGLGSGQPNHRILVIDDSPEIHADYAKILCPASARSADLAKLSAALFGSKPAAPTAGGAGAPPAGPAAPAGPAFVLDSAHQGEEGYDKVRAAVAAGRPYALAFVDMRMPPGWDGLRTIREVWQADPDLNIVVCTAYADHSWAAIESIAGAADRLLVLKKPFDPIEVKRLAATLTAKWAQARRAALKTAELESLVAQRTGELEQARLRDRVRMDELEAVVQNRTAELRQAATHDELTGLPNRALFHDRLVQAVELTRRQPGYRIAVLFIDFDRFKVVNDSLGHEAGDLLLRAISHRLSRVLRPTDTAARPEPPVMAGDDPSATTAARLGGDEFCILLSGLRRDEDAAIVATRILKALEAPYDIRGREVHSTASIGIATSAGGYERAQDMVRDADNAMYQAKAGGRGRYVIFDRAMHAQAMRRLMVEGDLRRSIERDELRVHYQPVVSLDTGRVVGFEALVRWQHPERGLISPGEFIGIAEETGFIDEIGAWVLGESCRQLADWRRRVPGSADLTVSVNASTRQLADLGFPNKVRAALADSGLAPDGLILEMTETALVQNAAATQAVLESVRGLGVRLYLDDFGTGYSSLSLLHTFPLDGLKIDRSFVREANNRRRYAAIIQVITGLAENLEIEVVAEGIESLEQVALLQSLACGKAQGYLFSRPAPADSIEELLLRNGPMWPPAMTAA